MLDRFDMSFLGCYLPRCMVDVDATFLYANSIVVPILGGSKYRFGWSKVTSFSSCAIQYSSSSFLLITCDVMVRRNVFYIDELLVIL